MKKTIAFLILLILVSVELFSASDDGKTRIAVNWIVGHDIASYCNIGFRDSSTKEILPSEKLQLEPVLEIGTGADIQLMGRKDGIEVFWEIYNKTEGISVELSIDGPMLYSGDGEQESLNWIISPEFADEEYNDLDSGSYGSQSIELEKLSGNANNFYSGSVPLIISTYNASGITIGRTFRGELTLAIVSN